MVYCFTGNRLPIVYLKLVWNVYGKLQTKLSFMVHAKEQRRPIYHPLCLLSVCLSVSLSLLCMSSIIKMAECVPYHDLPGYMSAKPFQLGIHVHSKLISYFLNRNRVHDCRSSNIQYNKVK